MDPKPRSLPRRFLGGFWQGLDASRRVALNLLFLALVVGLLAAMVAGGPKVPSSGALVLDPKGDLVEQLSARSGQAILESVVSGPKEETLLKDLVDALAAAKDDARITCVYLDLNHMSGGGLGMTKLEDLRAALLDFKKSGKKVIAYADSYQQAPYYLAVTADEVWLSPQGLAFFDGLGRWRNYYKDGLDRLDIDIHVFRVGEYKSAVEPYLRNDMSPEAKEADAKWLNDLWSAWLRDVAAARKLKPEDIKGYIEHMGERMDALKGDTAKMALEAKLVDKLAYRDELRARMIALAGEDKKEKSFNQVSVRDYLEAKGGDRTGSRGSGDAVAVIVAKGEILDGKHPAGVIGGDSTAKLIRKARQDDKVKAIVLRVDSPGGSAFASEVIRRELVLARQAGKKVVVSMGTLAASGGYWISTASDEIWASPETITGSIGIFGMFPSLDRTLSRFLGVHVDGVGTTPLSGALRPDRPFKPEVGKIIQSAIDHGYEEFLSRVAEARKMSRDDVDKIARGRVWSGADALQRKLVDKLGGLTDAIASARQMAQLPKDSRVWWVEEEKTFPERFFAGLMKGQARIARVCGIEINEPEPPPVPAAVRMLGEELRGFGLLMKFNDPNGVYAYFPGEVW